MPDLPAVTLPDTARWVAYYRAMESERPDALFRDPFARRLAGERGEAIMRGMRFGRLGAWPQIVRTAVMDEIILRLLRDGGVDTVLNLAAGLDARPYRLPLDPGIRWVEVDLPEIIHYKEAMLANDRPRCRLERVTLDLENREGRRLLFAEIDAVARGVLVIAEGLLVYLTADEVASLAADLAALPRFAFWLIDIISPLALRFMRRAAASRRVISSLNFQFAPANGAEFYAPFGWSLVEYRSMWLEGHKLKREMPLAPLYRLLYRRLWKAEIDKQSGPMAGVVLLKRMNGASSAIV